MKQVLPACLALLLAGAPAALADFELLLEDGKLLSGIDVQRRDGEYLLEMLDGETVSIPEELVAEVRITAGFASGVRKAEPEQLGGDEIDLESEDKPLSGLVKGKPEVLAGEEITPPRTSDQTAALGEPAEFTKGVFDPNWRPKSVYNESNDVTNFNPSTWAGNVIDPSWEPETDYNRASDVTEFNPSTFAESIIDSSWTPEDGFSKRGTSFSRDAARRGAARLVPFSDSRGTLSASGRPGPRPILTATRTSARPASAPMTFVSGRTAASTCTWCPRFALAATTGIPRSYAKSRAFAPAADRIRACAEKIFEPLLSRPGPDGEESTGEPDLRVRWIIDETLDRLPLEIYEGLLERGEKSTRIVFSYSQGDCRLLAGDLSSLLGRDLSEQDILELGASAFNGALEFAEPVRFVSEPDKIDYALSVSALIVPGSSDVRLLSSENELALDDDSNCGQSKRYRRKAVRLATRNLTVPTVRPGVSSDLVTFYSWDRMGGAVRSHGVLLSPAGEVELESELIATHAGDHECAEPE